MSGVSCMGRGSGYDAAVTGAAGCTDVAAFEDECGGGFGDVAQAPTNATSRSPRNRMTGAPCLASDARASRRGFSSRDCNDGTTPSVECNDHGTVIGDFALVERAARMPLAAFACACARHLDRGWRGPREDVIEA